MAADVVLAHSSWLLCRRRGALQPCEKPVMSPRIARASGGGLCVTTGVTMSLSSRVQVRPDHRMGLETSKLLLHMVSYCSLKGSKLSGPPEACTMHAVYRDLSHCQYPAVGKSTVLHVRVWCDKHTFVIRQAYRLRRTEHIIWLWSIPCRRRSNTRRILMAGAYSILCFLPSRLSIFTAKGRLQPEDYAEEAGPPVSPTGS